MLNILSNTPTWVIILFFVMLYLGIKRCYTRTMNPARLILLPLIFLVLSLGHLFHLFRSVPMTLAYWLVGILAGVYLGRLHVGKKTVRVNKQKWLIEVPGDWTMLLLIMGIFVVEYMINYLQAVSSPIAQSALFPIVTIIITSLITGMTIGRNGTYFYLFLSAPHDETVLMKKGRRF